MPKKKNISADLQGVTSLITDATVGITDLVEAMHRRVVHPPLLPSTPIQHLITTIAGITYTNVRWSTRLVGGGINKALGQLTSTLGESETTNKSDTIRAVLNGVAGDYLEDTENPLAITMQFRHQGKAIPLNRQSLKMTYPAINGHIFLMVHGSCMNDLQWTRKEHNHGTALAEEFRKTPIFLHYNSGRHISTNGQDLSELLEELVRQWPVPIEELNIVAHSMGGLVSRSALHYGQQQQKLWTSHLRKMIFLGTPHHGAPLEKAGHVLDHVLEAIPYAKPFARLGKIRSAGVTDLRYGNLCDEDWQHGDRFKMKGDKRQPIPLPGQVECFSIAGITSKKPEKASSRWKGDNMVSVKSALGQHKDPARHLNFKKENTCIAHEVNHLDLLSDPEIYEKMKSWVGMDV